MIKYNNTIHLYRIGSDEFKEVLKLRRLIVKLNYKLKNNNISIKISDMTIKFYYKIIDKISTKEKEISKLADEEFSLYIEFIYNKNNYNKSFNIEVYGVKDKEEIIIEYLKEFYKEKQNENLINRCDNNKQVRKINKI